MREGESLFTAPGCVKKRALIFASTVPSCGRDGGGEGVVVSFVSSRFTVSAEWGLTFVYARG